MLGIGGCCPHRPTPRATPAEPACPSHAARCDGRIRAVLQNAEVESERIQCSTLVRWEPSLSRYADRVARGIATLWGAQPDKAAMEKAAHHALGYLVRSYYDQISPHNLGVTLLEGLHRIDEQGHRRPLLLFRSAVTTSPDGSCQCFESLVRHGHVRHVVNLYGGSFPFRDMIEHERKLAATLGVTYFDAAEAPELAYRRLIERPEDYEKNRSEAMANLARLIREQLLRPNGREPRGNLYIHCGGGMHRSGMLFGVLQRCINGQPMDAIEREYKRHVGYISASEPGGYEALNVRFIREFDCSLLDRAKPDAK